MRHVRIGLLALLMLGSAPTRAQSPRAATGQVIVELVGLRSVSGQVFAALYRSADGFPTKAAKAFARTREKLKSKRLSIVFDAIPPGPFAVCVFHDENSNATLDTSLFGIPEEGWGMSRDAHAMFGPPSFEDARLTLRPGERKHIVVHLRY